MPEQEPVDWPVCSFGGLLQTHFDSVVAAGPDILILGTGRQQRFVAPALMAALIGKGIGIECMTNQAACRTYNLLVSEGRKVALALILEDTESN